MKYGTYTQTLERLRDDCNDTNDDEQEPLRFILVERSTFDRSAWLTTHDTKEAAAEYHDTQEMPEDWSIEKLVDCLTGIEFYAVPSTSFEPFPGGNAP